MNMVKFFTILGLLLLTVLGQAGEAEVFVLTTHSDPTHRAYKKFTVTADRLRIQPTWDPATEQPPLSVREAVGIATTWLAKQPLSRRSPRVRGIQLRPCPAPFQEKWCYMVRFDQPLDEPDWEKNPDWWKIPYEAIVLFDKTVVEPTLVTEAGQK